MYITRQTNLPCPRNSLDLAGAGGPEGVLHWCALHDGSGGGGAGGRIGRVWLARREGFLRNMKPTASLCNLTRASPASVNRRVTRFIMFGPDAGLLGRDVPLETVVGGVS